MILVTIMKLKDIPIIIITSITLMRIIIKKKLLISRTKMFVLGIL